jgi:hypothetical protein
MTSLPGSKENRAVVSVAVKSSVMKTANSARLQALPPLLSPA